MATFADLGNAYIAPETGAVFVKFIGACVVAAGAILTESGGTVNHTNRLSWAKGILSQDQQAVYSRVRAVQNYALATDANVQYSPANVLDPDIATAVQAAINALTAGGG